jgi:glycosyltransferase involved in cell wall biosynthesis
MKVLHLLRKYNPAEWGGTETAILQLLESLRDEAIESVVFAPTIDDVPEYDPLTDAGFIVKRFRSFLPVWGIGQVQRRQLVSIGGNLMSFDALWGLWREPRVSVVHVHTLGRVGGIGRTIARMRGLPYLVSIHGGYLDLPEAVRQNLAAPMKGGWEWGKVFGAFMGARRVVEDANAVITLNPIEAQLLGEKYPDKYVILLPHGVPMQQYVVDHRHSFYEAFPVLRGKHYLLVLGRIDPVKNQSWVIKQVPRIARDYPDLMLVLMGAVTDEEYGHSISKSVREAGLEGRVVLTGGIPPRDPRLAGALQAAEVVVVPSLSETFGLIILEAWAAGTAVMASRTSGAVQLIRDGRNGWLFELDDPGRFHAALAEILTDKKLRSKTIDAGRNLLAAEFDSRAQARRVSELYRQLCETRAK